MPITWRNIESDATRGAAGLMEVARRSLNDGFGVLNKTLETRNEIQDQNWEARKQTNTNAFLDRLAQFKTPEELAAAQASGELAALKQGFGGQVDAAAIRDAESGLQQKLIERITAQNQFADDTFNRNARPLMDQYQGYLARQDTAGAAKFLADNQLAVDESGALKNLQDLQKTLFSQKIDQGQLAVSQGNLQINRNQDLRAQAEHDDRMNQVLLGRAVDAGVAQSLQGATDLADARSRYSTWAEQNNIPQGLRTKGLQSLDQGYAQATGLTPEQDAQASAAVLPYEKDATLLEEQAKGFKVFSNPEVQNITESQALSKVLPRVKGEEDDTLAMIQDGLKKFREKHKLSDDYNLGAVLNEVLTATGKDEAIIGDDTLNLSKFSSNMEKVYGQFLRYEEAQAAAKKARAIANAKKLEEQNKFRVSNIRSNL